MGVTGADARSRQTAERKPWGETRALWAMFEAVCLCFAPSCTSFRSD
jgi:hypothetical protein